jgi:Raf kinase inhibitor-like YbhB/YbcL family protein
LRTLGFDYAEATRIVYLLDAFLNTPVVEVPMHCRILSLLCTLTIVAGCGGDSTPPPAAQQPAPPDPPDPLVLESSAFTDGAMLPPEYRCLQAPSPPLNWSGGPDDAQSYAIIMRDLDYMGGYLHWIIYDIPATTKELAQGVSPGLMPPTPAGAKQPQVIRMGYFGPCSPVSVNTYQFMLHAVDVANLTDVTETAPAADVATAIEAHSMESAALQVESGP